MTKNIKYNFKSHMSQIKGKSSLGSEVVHRWAEASEKSQGRSSQRAVGLPLARFQPQSSDPKEANR